MNTYADKTQENKNQSVVNAASQKQSCSRSTFQFVDNRPEAVTQRKLQEMANNSPLAKQVAQLQAMADTHSAQHQQPIQKKENNTGLPDNLKSGIENLSGYSMDDVKVHYNSDKPAQLQAHAYAQGTDIHLASGQEKHLGHEAWHVVQQKEGRVKPTMQMKGGVNVNADVGLEKEADVMGAKALKSGEDTPKVNQLKATGNIQASSVQRKMGVEFESEWKVWKDKETPIGKDLHKKKVTGTGEYRVENDGGELEFVSDPPSDDGEKLIATVGKMQEFANTMIANNKKAERLEALPENAILVKVDPSKYIKAHKTEEMSPQALVAAIYADEYNDKLHLAEFITAMKKSGWVNDKGVKVEDGPWSVGDYEPVFTIELPKTKALIPQLDDSQYQKLHSVKHVLGKDPESDFASHYIHVEDAETEMRTKPQFSFGVPMEMIPKLFKGFATGLGNPDEQSGIHYKSSETTKLHDYSKTVGQQLTLSESYPKAEIMKGKTGGFLTYLNFYLDKMRQGMSNFNKSYSAAQIKSVHLAQTIIRNAKVNAESADIYDLNNESITAVLKDLLLTEEDKKQINEKLVDKEVDKAIEEEKITKTQFTSLSTYHAEAIEKTKKDLSYPKYYFALMNRSGFDRMYDALGDEQKTAVDKHVTGVLIPKLLNAYDHKALFSVPYFYKTKVDGKITEFGFSYGPTLEAWWKSIAGGGRQELKVAGSVATTERDRMSPPQEFVDRRTKEADTDQSLGALNLVDEGKVVMELRNWGDYVPASEWVKHTTDMAKALAKLLE